MIRNKLVILGAGGYGRMVADIATQLDYEIEVLDDSFKGKELSLFTNFINKDTLFIPAFGNNEFRMKWIGQIEKQGGLLATLIHPSAYVSPTAVIHDGTVILPMAVINAETTVGKGVIVNSGAIIDHGCVIEDGAHLCVGAIIKAENRIKSMLKIEAGEVIEARKWPV